MVKYWDNMKSRKLEIQQVRTYFSGSLLSLFLKVLTLKEDQLKQHNKHVSDLNSIEETLKRKTKMLQTVKEGAEMQEVFQRETQILENQLKSDSSKLESVKREVVLINQNKAQEERKRIHKQNLMNQKQSLANELASLNHKKAEIESRRQQETQPELTTPQKDLKVSQVLL